MGQCNCGGWKDEVVGHFGDVTTPGTLLPLTRAKRTIHIGNITNVMGRILNCFFRTAANVHVPLKICAGNHSELISIWIYYHARISNLTTTGDDPVFSPLINPYKNIINRWNIAKSPNPIDPAIFLLPWLCISWQNLRPCNMHEFKCWPEPRAQFSPRYIQDDWRGPAMSPGPLQLQKWTIDMIVLQTRPDETRSTSRPEQMNILRIAFRDESLRNWPHEVC